MGPRKIENLTLRRHTKQDEREQVQRFHRHTQVDASTSRYPSGPPQSLPSCSSCPLLNTKKKSKESSISIHQVYGLWQKTKKWQVKGKEGKGGKWLFCHRYIKRNTRNEVPKRSARYRGSRLSYRALPRLKLYPFDERKTLWVLFEDSWGDKLVLMSNFEKGLRCAKDGRGRSCGVSGAGGCDSLPSMWEIRLDKG